MPLEPFSPRGNGKWATNNKGRWAYKGISIFIYFPLYRPASPDHPSSTGTMVVEPSTCIDAFLDIAPVPPPPPFLLTAQTNIFYAIPPPQTVLAQESVCRKPSSSPCRTGQANRRSISPYIRPANLAVRFATPLCNDDTDDTDDIDNSNGSFAEDAQARILKPPGEPGRPRRGGYTLDTALGLSSDEVKNLKVRQRFSHL